MLTPFGLHIYLTHFISLNPLKPWWLMGAETPWSHCRLMTVTLLHFKYMAIYSSATESVKKKTIAFENSEEIRTHTVTKYNPFSKTRNIFRFPKIILKSNLNLLKVSRLPRPLLWCTVPLLPYWV